MFFVMIILMFLGCSGPTKGPVQAEVLTADSSNPLKLGLRTVTLHTVNDITRLDGANFSFIANAKIDSQSMHQLRKSVSSFAELIDLNRDTLSLEVPVLNIFYDGKKWRWHDFDSLLMLTAFHNFEIVWDFFTNIIGDKSKATSTTIPILIYADAILSTATPIPTLVSDNAAFVQEVDAFMLFRVGDQHGNPLAMNLAVIAHEFQHRIFFHNVWAQPGAFEAWNALADRLEKREISRSDVLLAATEEGLADLVGLAVSGSKEAMLASFVGADQTISQRDVEGTFADNVTYDDLATKKNLDKKFIELCGGHSFDYQNGSWNYYCLGTVLARTMWDAVDRDVEILRNILLPLIHKSLPTIGLELARTKEYDMDVLLEQIVNQAKVAGRASLAIRLCSSIGNKFPSFVSDKRIPSCVP